MRIDNRGKAKFPHSKAVMCVYQSCVAIIGGFKGEAGEALPPQIFLTLKFVVCIALKIIEIVAT